MPKIAMVFPGQGSQYVGMGQDLYHTYARAQEVFDQADQTLGFSLSRLCFEGPREELQETINAQPAVLTMSVACLAALGEELGGQLTPAMLAGHSLGEYTALVAAGAADFCTVLRLVRERGRLMQEAARQKTGQMVAIIGLEDQVVEEICRQAGRPGSVVCLANYNSPGQAVISGEARAVQRAVELAKSRGARHTIPLPVVGAFHSPLMAPAQAGLAQALATVSLGETKVPLLCNVSAQPCSQPGEIAENLRRQLCSPVQWARIVRHMSADGATLFLEVGPGQVLSGLIRRIEQGAKVVSMGSAQAVGGFVREWWKGPLSERGEGGGGADFGQAPG